MRAIACIFDKDERKQLTDHLKEHTVDYMIAISLDYKAARNEEFCDQAALIVKAATIKMLYDLKAAKPLIP